MAALRKIVRVCLPNTLAKFQNVSVVPCRWSNRLPNRTLERARNSKLTQSTEEDDKLDEVYPLVAPREYRHVYPEFLPDPNWLNRDYLTEKLERREMLRRRQNIAIPEFYVGSIMAVTVSDPHAPGKQNRFVGICIDRGGHGLRAHFTLRNVVDGQGVEIMYDMYNPTVQKIEVLKLEKRLDSRLFYLRDALPEYSTIPFDFPVQPHPKGAPVPVNQIKVKLGPRPWLERYERQDLQGVQDLGLPEKFYKRACELATPWEKYDLMKQYRASIPDDEQEEIYTDVHREKTRIDKKGKPK